MSPKSKLQLSHQRDQTAARRTGQLGIGVQAWGWSGVVSSGILFLALSLSVPGSTSAHQAHFV